MGGGLWRCGCTVERSASCGVWLVCGWYVEKGWKWYRPLQPPCRMHPLNAGNADGVNSKVAAKAEYRHGLRGHMVPIRVSKHMHPHAPLPPLPTHTHTSTLQRTYTHVYMHTQLRTPAHAHTHTYTHMDTCACLHMPQHNGPCRCSGGSQPVRRGGIHRRPYDLPHPARGRHDHRNGRGPLLHGHLPHRLQVSAAPPPPPPSS